MLGILWLQAATRDRNPYISVLLAFTSVLHIDISLARAPCGLQLQEFWGNGNDLKPGMENSA